MSVLEVSDGHVISLLRELPAERKRTALLALAQDGRAAGRNGCGLASKGSI